MTPHRFSLFFIALLAPSAVRGDGGTVRVSERVGPYLVSVFTSPTPWRAGPVDVSVFVQDADNRALVREGTVTVKAWLRDRPGDAITYPATAEAATNQLFRAAVFDLPEPGWWDVEVSVEGPKGPAVVRFAAEAGGPLPAVPDLAAWIGWPAAVVAAFVVHRALVRRKRSS